MSYYDEKLSEYRSKYGMDGLQIEGFTPKEPTSLSEVLNELDKQEAQKEKLRSVKIAYGNSPCFLYYSVRI
jgi:hypothetical protein